MWLVSVFEFFLVAIDVSWYLLFIIYSSLIAQACCSGADIGHFYCAARRPTEWRSSNYSRGYVWSCMHRLEVLLGPTAGNFWCLVANIVKTLLKNQKFWASICASNIIKTYNKISLLSYQGRLKTFWVPLWCLLNICPKKFCLCFECFQNSLHTALTEQHWIFSWFCRKTIFPTSKTTE